MLRTFAGRVNLYDTVYLVSEITVEGSGFRVFSLKTAYPFPISRVWSTNVLIHVFPVPAKSRRSFSALTAAILFKRPKLPTSLKEDCFSVSTRPYLA